MTVSNISPSQGCGQSAAIDPLSDQMIDHPYPLLNELREQTRIQYLPDYDYWILTRHEDIEKVFSDPSIFSAGNAQQPLTQLSEHASAVLADGLRNNTGLAWIDPPAHGRIRLAAMKSFLPRRIEAMRPQIEQRVDDLLGRFERDGSVELVDALTHPLPALTVFGMIGFDDADLPQLKDWCADKLEVNWGRPSVEYQERAATNMAKFWAYCEDFVNRRAEEFGDDITSDMLRDRAQSTDPLTNGEITSILFALSFAGHETTTNLISNAMRQLLLRPSLWERVVKDQSLVPDVVEEALRFDSSVISWRRITTQETEVAGMRLPAGSRLILSLASANHDPRQFPQPEEFILQRPNSRSHLSFGKGNHFCLGQGLARIEADIAISTLARRLPGMRLSEQEFKYPPNIAFRGPYELHVEWDKS